MFKKEAYFDRDLYRELLFLIGQISKGHFQGHSLFINGMLISKGNTKFKWAKGIPFSTRKAYFDRVLKKEFHI